MPFDRRLFAYRADLAEDTLLGKVNAEQFTAGTKGRIGVSVADLRAEPKLGCGIDTQLLYGEPVTVFDRKGDWAWVKSDIDSYVGYLPDRYLAEDDEEVTHWVTVPRTFLYPEAELKTAPSGALSMGSRLTVVDEAKTRGTLYYQFADGRFIIAAHCKPVGKTETQDFVAVAARFLETPYLWGGRSGFGLDCSALVQLSLMMAGVESLRDSDLQALNLGKEIAPDQLTRGDLVFWKGHVGIMEDAATLLHANGHTMSVAREAYKDAVKRIAPVYGEPTEFRRL